MGKKALAAVVTTLIVIVVLAIALYHLLAAGFQDGLVTAKLAQGYVRGRTEKTTTGVEFLSFRGIPYAKAPVGELRFKAPRPAEDWDGILDGTRHRNSCLSSDLLGDEDCLFINVYTTELGGSRPVMVWIHGGGFSSGSGNDSLYGPHFLLDQGVVVVTFNYRLGVLGFLSTGDSLVPGNAGLKDQVMALRWVQSNVAKFGGDAGAVTILGTDAGGASVTYHMLSPLSKGLFARAVAMSGSALNPWSFSPSQTLKERAFLLGGSLAQGRAFDQDTVALVAFLSQVPAADLVARAGAALSPQDKRRILTYPFVPCAEVPGEGAFLTDPPSRVLSEGRLNPVPFLTGSLSGDGKIALHNVGIPDNATKLKALGSDFASVVAPEMRLKGAEDRLRAAALVRAFYFEKEPLTPSLAQSIRDLLTDMLFLEGIDAFARVVGKSSDSTVFYYYFSYEGNVTLAPGVVDMSGVPGVPHGSDIAYLWKLSNNRQNLNPDSKEATVRSTFVKLITNFVKTGAPTMQVEQRDRWEPFTASKPVYLDVDSPLSLHMNLFKARLDFWRSLLPLS